MDQFDAVCMVYWGALLFSLGIIGEYIGKTYMEVKHRPRFIISEFIDENKFRGGVK